MCVCVPRNDFTNIYTPGGAGQQPAVVAVDALRRRRRVHNRRGVAAAQGHRTAGSHSPVRSPYPFSKCVRQGECFHDGLRERGEPAEKPSRVSLLDELQSLSRQQPGPAQDCKSTLQIPLFDCPLLLFRPTVVDLLTM